MHIKATWDGNEGEVKFSRAFDKLNKTQKLDLLQDAMYEIQEKYNFLMTVKELQ